TVAQVDQPPVNTVPGFQSTNQNVAKTFSSANGNASAVADPDASASPVKVTLSVTAGTGTLTLPSTTGLSLVSGSNGSASMTFTGTLASFNAALNGLVFTPATNYSGFSTLTITTDDQGNTGLLPNGVTSLTDTDTVTIQVVGIDQPPVN